MKPFATAPAASHCRFHREGMKIAFGYFQRRECRETGGSRGTAVIGGFKTYWAILRLGSDTFWLNKLFRANTLRSAAAKQPARRRPLSGD